MPAKLLSGCLLLLVSVTVACVGPGAQEEAAPESPETPAGRQVAQFEALRARVTAEAAVVVAVPLHPRGARRCPNGEPPLELSYPLCQQPVLNQCTLFLCTDPSTGHWFRHPDRPNPECRQTSMQTEECSNEETLPEAFVVSADQLGELLPLLAPEQPLEDLHPGADR